jgi:hypothetical protein
VSEVWKWVCIREKEWECGVPEMWDFFAANCIERINIWLTEGTMNNIGMKS